MFVDGQLKGKRKAFLRKFRSSESSFFVSHASTSPRMTSTKKMSMLWSFRDGSRLPIVRWRGRVQPASELFFTETQPKDACFLTKKSDSDFSFEAIDELFVPIIWIHRGLRVAHHRGAIPAPFELHVGLLHRSSAPNLSGRLGDKAVPTHHLIDIDPLATRSAVREPINAWWLVCYSQPWSWLRVWHSVPPVCRIQSLVIQSPAVIASRALNVEPWYDDMLHATDIVVMFSTVSDISIPPVTPTQSAPDKSPYLSNVFGAFW